MHCSIHHTHLFASNMEATVRFFVQCFDGKVVLDGNFAGARNVFIAVGKGRVHVYDQPPKAPGRSNVHHIGIQTDDIDAAADRIRKAGVTLRKDVTDLGMWKYVMVPGPDDLLIELFEVDTTSIPRELAGYFV